MENIKVVYYDPFSLSDDEEILFEEFQIKEKELADLVEIYEERQKHNNKPVFFKQIEPPKFFPIEVPNNLKTQVYELSNHRKLFIKTA